MTASDAVRFDGQDWMVVEGDGFTMLRTDDDGWITDDRGWITGDPDIWKVTP